LKNKVLYDILSLQEINKMPAHKIEFCYPLCFKDVHTDMLTNVLVVAFQMGTQENPVHEKEFEI